MAEKLSYLIIGNGIAGVTAAEILRAQHQTAEITVIADDPFPVYYRPALKDYLAGRVREDKLWARPNNFYQEQHIRFLSDRLVGIQVGQHSVQLQSGRQLNYQRLLLANGARASQLSCPGLELAGVTTLRTVADYQTLLSRLDSVRRIVVSGSGTLALETIETLRHRGFEVTHLLRRRTLWSEVLDATASDLVIQQERRAGVDVRQEEEIAAITGKRRVSGVVTTSGGHIPCEMVVIAIGIEPNIEPIKRSGIPCGRGVRVDHAMRTGAPDVYAAGDVIEVADAAQGRTRVLGQWFPAIQQARAAAYSMLGVLDSGRPFQSTAFYNATFLYDLEFASCGLTSMPDNGGYREIVADPQPRIYRKALLRGNVLVGVLALGERKHTLAFKRAIDHRVDIAPVAAKLFAPDFNLNDWLDQQGVPPPLLKPERVSAPASRQAEGAEETGVGETTRAQPRIATYLVPGRDMRAASQADRLPSGESKTLAIGRQPGVYLLIDDGSVSRRHAEITCAAGRYTVSDLGSSNGTFVNAQRLKPGTALALKAGDTLRFGDAYYTFLERSLAEASEAAPSARSGKGDQNGDHTSFQQMTTGFYEPDAVGAIPPAGQPIINADGSLTLPGATSAVPAAEVTRLRAYAALIVITRGVPTVHYLKPGQSVTLGRDKKRDLPLLDAAASRKHARVFHAPDGFYIRDAGSSNGVIVNQARIDNPYRLTHGDRITIGSIQIYFFDPGENASIPSADVPPTGRLAPLQNATAGEAATAREKVCRSCGAENLSRARFCTTCGTPIV